jgi:putative ATP-dependent endonuclease of OLD family
LRLSKLRIQNFRSFEDETINFNNYTCLAGANGAGKSTVFTALNVLFKYTNDASTNVAVLDREDFHNKNTATPVTITATFTDLKPEAQSDFSNYVRQGQLIISAVAEWGGSSATVKQYGERLANPDFAAFFKADGDGAKVDELRKHYAVIKAKYKHLADTSTKAGMTQALRDDEAANPQACNPLRSEDQFYGVSKGKNLLEKYVQWIFVPAVKDVSAEQIESRKTALGLLLEHTVRTKVSFAKPIDTLRNEIVKQYSDILQSQQNALTALSNSLKNRLRDWAHPNASVRVQWQCDASKAVSLADPLAELIT